MCQKDHLINLDKLIWTYPLCLGDLFDWKNERLFKTCKKWTI